MASPLTHIAAGYAIYGISQGKKNLLHIVNWRFMLILAVSQLPDADSIIGLLTGNMHAAHNQWSHSILFGTALTGLIAFIVYLIIKKNFLKWWLILLSCYLVQIFIDFLTFGRGVMLFWPFTPERFSSPLLLFYGLHWSEGFISIEHLFTLLNEAAIIGFVILAYYIGKTCIHSKKDNTDKKHPEYR